MNLNSNSYVLTFAVSVCVVVSAALSLVANGLRETQQKAAEFDRQKNVMLAAGLYDPKKERSREELEQLYKDRVAEAVVDTETGQVVADREADGKQFRFVATTKDEGGKVEAYVLPISGKGLWSTLYGYLALGADKNTVRGITFYKHGETPGLGGEVENASWQGQWVGKTVLDQDGKLTSVTIKKGQVDAGVAKEKAHYVDGLSGATITCNGVNQFVKADLQAFAKYLGWEN